MNTYSLTVHVDKGILNAFDKTTFNRSQSIRRAILKANDDPQTLVEAFKQRLVKEPNSDNLVTVTFRHGADVAGALQRLSKSTRYPVEQIVRLAMESHPYV